VILETRTKIALARVAHRAISAGRSLCGRSDRTEVTRSGIRWSLDLNEGIDFSIYLLGAFERSTVNTLKRLVREGDTVLDIGANIGAHTLFLAQSVGQSGHVFAFEPSDYAFEKLKANLAVNPRLRGRVTADQIMLTAEMAQPIKDGVYASWPLQADGELHPKHLGRRVSTKNAAAETLESYFRRNDIRRVDVIKIDVDGNELPVLQGGLEMLARFQPKIVMEVSPYVHDEENNSFEALIGLLKDCKYSLLHARTLQPLPLDAAHLRELVPDGAGINVIAEAGR
jgi:FkbM family methyltransferase